MDCKAVVGLYGVSGSGKSRLLSMLQSSRPEWRCLEGSHVISTVMEEQGESMNDFYSKNELEKEELRNRAVKMIQGYHGVTIVAGHCSFPETDGMTEDRMAFHDVFTKGDGETFDVIVYLDKIPMDVYRQREQDNETTKRSRPSLSLDVIQQWIEHEKQVLRNECEKHGIQFALVSNEDLVEDHIVEHVLAPLFAKVRVDSEQNLKRAVGKIPASDIFLLIDGDRTLCPIDTGKVFIDHLPNTGNANPLKKIFKRYDSYSFRSFLEVALFYANVMPTPDYQDLSLKIGRDYVMIHDEWIRFLTDLPPNVHAIVLTSGNREIWHAAVASNNLDNMVTLLAGNHVGLHQFVVDSHAKAEVVKELRDLHGCCKILSFGDSAVDIPMLRASDRGYIVIDDRQNRSMKDFVCEQVASGGAHHLYQLNLLPDSSFLHDGIQTGSLERLLADLTNSTINKVLDCAETSTAARVLATQSRRSDMNGPALQDVHVQIGRFLANRLLDEVGRYGMLTEQNSFTHVQGNAFHGLVTSGNVLILPLMRGGEPLSRGVHQCFPHARLIHYNDNDAKSSSAIESMLDSKQIKDVIVVDSVVNEGRSVRRVIASVANGNKNCLRIYVLTAVMQHEASLQLSKDFPRVIFLALRISENKYTGKRGTDTGNRLFGTY